jgi:hypothetical protein
MKRKLQYIEHCSDHEKSIAEGLLKSHSFEFAQKYVNAVTAFARKNIKVIPTISIEINGEFEGEVQITISK